MNRNTVHSPTTRHGFRTPHRYPDTGESELSVLNVLSSQLYPTGRAWYNPEGGVFERFHESINTSFLRLNKSGQDVISSRFPDNDNFTEEDASIWEYRLGLQDGSSVALEYRKSVIKRKMGYPNNIKARQHVNFIEFSLRLAGFNVWVHENPYPYYKPSDVMDNTNDENGHGGGNEHSDETQHVGDFQNVIANSIDVYEFFDFGDILSSPSIPGNGNPQLWATFFIGGEVLGSFAEIEVSRLRQFKELVINLKPAHTVAFTFINYT